MKKKLYVCLLALAVALVSFPVSTGAQGGARAARGSRAVRAAVAQSAANEVLPLPASDAVMFVELRRLFAEAIPRAFADNPQKVAEINADVEQFKARTGIDARQFDRLAVGARLTVLSPTATKIDNIVAVARGTFSPGALVAAGRLASKGGYREVKHAGKTVYVFSINERIKVFGLLRMRVGELAAVAIDDRTLAVGDLESVTAAVDAAGGRGRVSPEVVTLARQNPNAIVGFGGTIPPAFSKSLATGISAELDKSVASIRQFYGSVGTTANGFDMLTALRTETPAEARDLRDTVEAVKQFAPALISMSGKGNRLAQKAIESLKVSAQGNEVQVRAALASGDLAAIIKAL